jgi:hydroxymethylpyrimidine pyrophosphatase-like HAD family hydrolase
MACGTPEEMDRAEAWLAESRFAERIETHQTRYPARRLSILDILPPGCSKGVALRKLAERRGLQSAEIMAIGDNYNDVEMLGMAGYPVLMSNAAPELLAAGRKRGWRIAPTNDENGVATVIEDVLAGRNTLVCNTGMVE